MAGFAAPGLDEAPHLSRVRKPSSEGPRCPDQELRLLRRGRPAQLGGVIRKPERKAGHVYTVRADPKTRPIKCSL